MADRKRPPPGYVIQYTGHPNGPHTDAVIEWSEFGDGPKSESEAIEAAWKHFRRGVYLGLKALRRRERNKGQ